MTTDTLKTIADSLAKPFPSKELMWRPASISNGKGRALPYLTARHVLDRLDEVLGFNNWKDEYFETVAGNKVVAVRCRLSVRLEGEWLSKEDATSVDAFTDKESAELAVKGAYSDALKRAAVKFGLGRYLYRFNAPWIELERERLPSWFNPLMFLQESMVPEDEVEALRAAQEGGVPEVEPPVEARPDPRTETKPAPVGIVGRQVERKGPAPAEQEPSQPEHSEPSEGKPSPSGAVKPPAPAGAGEGGYALEDDTALVAGVKEKVAKGASLMALHSYLSKEKVYCRLTKTTHEQLMAEISKTISKISK